MSKAKDTTKAIPEQGQFVSTADAAGIAASFISDNIAPVIAAIIELSKFDGLNEQERRRRAEVIHRLAKLGHQLADEAATHHEYEQHYAQQAAVAIAGAAA